MVSGPEVEVGKPASSCCNCAGEGCWWHGAGGGGGHGFWVGFEGTTSMTSQWVGVGW